LICDFCEFLSFGDYRALVPPLTFHGVPLIVEAPFFNQTHPNIHPHHIVNLWLSFVQGETHWMTKSACFHFLLAMAEFGEKEKYGCREIILHKSKTKSKKENIQR